jgi:DNA ligase-associated metallophosphoesterase
VFQEAVNTNEADTTVFIRFAGHMFEPLASGALYWRAEKMLLVADLHLEKMSSFARRGQMLPPYDTGLTLRRLEQDLVETGAATVIALGDSFHRDEGTASLQDLDRARLDGLMERCEWIWLSGNHDPTPHQLGGRCLAQFAHRGLTLTHEPQRSVDGLISGHLHPAARVLMNGRSVRRGCFVHDSRLMIMPAYGVSTGTLNILSPAFIGLFAWSEIKVTMMGRDRLYPVSPKRLVGG